MPRRLRTDSIATHAAAVRHALDVHDWPLEVPGKTDVSVSIFRKMQAQRAYVDWTPGDLLELARGCTLIEDVVSEAATLRNEGYVIDGANGGPVKNPRAVIVAALNTQINALLRRLGITRMSVLETGAGAKRAAQARQATEQLSAAVADKANTKRKRGGGRASDHDLVN